MKYPLIALIKLLCLGDAHLGRYPSRVPTDDPSLSVRSVWRRAVTQAIENNVDAVILTGDMADNNNSYFEAYGALRSEISRLSQCDIPVVAVAGNHDHEVFPRLADSISDDNLTLLGQSGTWEEEILKTRSGRSLRFVGWSFPAPTMIGRLWILSTYRRVNTLRSELSTELWRARANSPR